MVKISEFNMEKAKSNNTIDLSSIEALSTALNSCFTDFEDKHQLINTIYESSIDYWVGKAKNSFVNKYESLNEKYTAMLEKISSFKRKNESLRSAVSSYNTAVNKINSLSDKEKYNITVLASGLESKRDSAKYIQLKTDRNSLASSVISAYGEL